MNLLWARGQHGAANAHWASFNCARAKSDGPELWKREPVEANPIHAKTGIGGGTIELDGNVDGGKGEGLRVAAGCYFKPGNGIRRDPHPPVGAIVLNM